ncbi:MAG: AraC family transcriptional regulator [Flavobacteriaceae bacterium]|nr:AraC family transcriptional regulator [Flavobacteriaceae bacterium]
MKKIGEILTCTEYKKRFLSFLPNNIILNKDKIQVYRIQNYLKGILPVEKPYKTAFGFLIFVTCGSVTQQLEKKVFKVEKSQCINVKQGDSTRTLDISNDAEGYVVNYEIESFTCSFQFSDGKHSLYTLDNSDTESMDLSLYLLEKELKEKRGRFTVSLNLFNSILARLVDYQTLDLANVKDIAISTKFKSLLEECFLEHKSVSFYADSLAISQSYLHKCIKKTTGKSPKHWIDEYCVEQGKILLQNFSKNIAEIAYELNFESASYFTRLFKKITNITPKKYRENLQQKILKDKKEGIA